MIKGVLFDKDGTLFDFNATWGAWAAVSLRRQAGGDESVFAALCEVLGFDATAQVFRPDSLVIASTLGDVVDAILTVIPGNRDTLMEELKGEVGSVPQVAPVPLKPLLSDLAGMGLKLGVATNDAEAPARANLAQVGVEEMFDFIAGYDSGFGGKPETGQMEAFCAATRLEPRDCVMVGDSLHDLHSGRAAGMHTVGVLTGPAPRAELEPFADVVLQNIGELPDWIAGLS